MAESFDTHKAFLELTKSDCFPAEQAEKLVALVNGAVVANVATKSDLENLEKTLKSEMAALEKTLKSDMGTLKSDMEALNKSLKSDMDARDKSLKLDMKAQDKYLKLEMEALEKKVFDQMKTLKNDLTLRVVSAIVIAVGVLKAFDYLLPI